MDKFKEIMGKIWAALKRFGVIIADVMRRAWELICKYTPIIWAAIRRFCAKVWTMTKHGTAKLLGVDEFVNHRAVMVTLTCFAAIILLLVLVFAT